MEKTNSNSISDLDFLKKVYFMVRPYKTWLFLCVLLTLVSAVCDILGVYMIKSMIDNALKGHNQTILSFAGILAVIVVSSVLSKYLITYSAGRLGTYSMRDLRNQLISRIEKSPVYSIEKNHSGDILSRLTNDISSIESFITGNLSDYIYIPLIILTSSIFLACLNWKLYLVSFIVTPIGMFLTRKLSKPISTYSKKNFEYLSEVNATLQDTIGGINIIKAFNLEKPLREKCRISIENSVNVGIKSSKKIASVIPIRVSMYRLPYVLCVVVGGYMAFNGNLETGSLIAFIQLLGLLIQPTIRLPDMVTNMQNTLGAAVRIFEIQERETEREDGDSFSIQKIDHSEGLPVIELSNVTFGYKKGVEVLKNLSLTINGGETVALVGPSGCGKSTIINLICNFYNLNDGCMKLFERDFRTLKLSDIRNCLSLVSQDTYLFPGSIEENIRYGKPDATEQEIINAAVAAHAHEFIEEMPEGYNTLVGERGIKLSGGQKQRIAIARAFLKNAPVLLLDEPTSALDTQSEAIVQEALNRITENRTVLIVAHRLSTIKNANKIIVLNEGDIVETGTHEELIEKEGLYSQLYYKQFSATQNDLDEERGA